MMGATWKSRREYTPTCAASSGADATLMYLWCNKKVKKDFFLKPKVVIFTYQLINNTMTDKITSAFKALRKHGYTARQNFSCCSSCAWSELADQGKDEKVVFYNRQSGAALRGVDRRRFRHSPQVLYLNWSGDAAFICSELEAAGLTVIRPESEVSAIGIEIC